MLISLIFPIAVSRRQRFQLRSEDYALLRRYLSMYPSETGLSHVYPPNLYHDAVRKYFLLGASDTARLSVSASSIRSGWRMAIWWIAPIL
jgi:hypothetical protein